MSSKPTTNINDAFANMEVSPNNLEIDTQSHLNAPSADQDHLSQRSGFRFCDLPAELRCHVYDELTKSRVIDVLNSEVKFHDGDKISYVSATSKFLQQDIEKWRQARKYPKCPVLGLYNPADLKFQVEFRALQYKRSEIADSRSDREFRIWDYFAHSDIARRAVRHLEFNLDPMHIFAEFNSYGPQCSYVLQMDLRYVQNFQSLERIDFRMDTWAFWLNVNEIVGPTAIAEAMQRRKIEFETWNTILSSALWHAFWKFCGRCHPAKACTCCILPEVSFWYVSPDEPIAGKWPWTKMELRFEKEESRPISLDEQVFAHFYEPTIIRYLQPHQNNDDLDDRAFMRWKLEVAHCVRCGAFDHTLRARTRIHQE